MFYFWVYLDAVVDVVAAAAVGGVGVDGLTSCLPYFFLLLALPFNVFEISTH